MAPKIIDNRWQLIEQLPEGGQSHVFLVRDLSKEFTEECVLKRLKNIKRIARFEREIRAGKTLKHPAIAPVLYYSLENQPYFITKHYPGPTLESVAPLRPLNALSEFTKICEALHYAHGKGIVHRDLKPENIILDANRKPVILDFGLCYMFDEDSRITATMEQVGSRFYMAPELESGRADEISNAVDSYSLGKILYFLLTGKHLAREDYLGENELTKVCMDSQLGYVTERILASSLVREPSKRSSTDQLGKIAAGIHRLIGEHFYPGTVGSRCRFCGEGQYTAMPETGLRVWQPGIERNISYSPIICPMCGNVQWFLKRGQ